MTRVLLTGASGFAGAHALRHLLTGTDWDLTCPVTFRHRGSADRIASSLRGNPAWYDRTDVVMHDLTAPLSPQELTRGGEVDYIVAYASQSHVDRAIADPAPFVRNNVDVALATLETARALRPEAVVWVSTDEVYGPIGRGEPGMAEWAPILPSNPYSASKAAQEAVAVSYWRTYGVPVVIVNCMNMIGEMQDPEKFVPMVTRRVLSNGTVTIHGTPGDIGSRCYLHARNLADAVLHILLHLPPARFPQSPRPDRYHVAGLEQVSNLDLARQIAAIAGRPLRYRLEDFHTTRPGHDPHYGLDSSKITAAGWKAPVPFAESLERTVRWTMEHPEWLA